MPGPYEDVQSPRLRVRKAPSLTAFKGDDIDPKDIEPFHFPAQTSKGCQQGDRHLDVILARRDISGRTKEYLRLLQSKYKHGACTTVLGRAREDLVREIKVLEDMWASHWDKVYGPRSDRARFEQLSEELKELKFYAIFEDYAAIFCKEIKNLGQSYPINHFKQWKDAEEKLEEEDRSLANWWSDRSKELPETPLCDSIVEVAGRLNPPTDPAMVRFWIKMYATRNETFHCGVNEAIDDNNWMALSSLILTHRKLLPSVLPSRHDCDNILVLKTIQRLAKRHFEPGWRLSSYSQDLDQRRQQRRVRSTGGAAASRDQTEA